MNTHEHEHVYQSKQKNEHGVFLYIIKEATLCHVILT